MTPIQNMNRTATRDVELRGADASARATSCCCSTRPRTATSASSRDPHRFDVDARARTTHVAFGGYGAHFCLGASLARLELRVMFEELLAALPDLELASDEPLPLRPSNFIVGIETMPVVWQR